MAKRSIEIAISATNNTAGAFEKAKADVQRFTDDVKRIQQNVRVGGDEFGGGLAGAQGGLARARAKAFDLQRISERSALEKTAWEENKRYSKEQFDGIRASVGATNELAGSHRKVSAEIARSNAGMDKSVEGAIRFGKAMIAVRAATEATHAVAFLLEGDFAKAAEAIERAPIIGELVGGAKAGFHLGQAAAGAILGGGPGFDNTQGNEWTEARIRLDKENRERLASQQASWAAEGMSMIESERGRQDRLRRDQEEALAAQQAAAADMRSEDQAETMRMDMETEERQRNMDADAAERRKNMEADTAKDIARLKIETSTTGLAKELALLDLKRREELANAELTEAMKSQIREKYGLQEGLIRRGYEEKPREAGGGVAAQEAGYLTGVGRHSAEGAAATQMTQMVRSLKKIETRGVVVEASGEFLEWLRKNAPPVPAGI